MRKRLNAVYMAQNSKKNILLVDANVETRSASATYLRTSGYDVWEASSGAEALKLAPRNPALIVLDIHLSDMSGFEVCAKLKKIPETATTPILHTSATHLKSDERVRGLECGADGYLFAPIQPEELVATIRALLRTRRAEVVAHTLAVQWETTFDAISDGVCVTAANGKIERCNFGFSQILKKPFEEIVGQTFAQLGKSQLLFDLSALPVTSNRRKEISESKSGSSWLRISGDPIWSETKQVAGAVYIVTDITERKEAEIALASANAKIQRHALELEEKVVERTAELRRNIKSLDTFCYTIAHDLKSPLRSIKGFTNILREEYAHNFDESGKDYTKRIVDSVERMNRLIDDLLDYGRLANMDLPIQALNVEEEVEFVLNELWADIKARNAEINIGKPLHPVQGNPTVLRQVLANLLSNAMKFVAPGLRPEICISTEATKGSVRIIIQDNGIGIEPSCFKRIFDVFERLHGKDSGYPGTGIGLAIVRKGIERMGGSVGVESEVGKGSRFWVELPEPGTENTQTKDVS